MSLRRQHLSPTANLLRNSRLFSLPNPLPRPLVAEPNGSGSLKASDSATLPYPTHQAIATTPSSLARGDWGLKRPLPSRSRIVQTSNPVVRVKQWDTVEHVTDFDSAADHVRTRQKFEELSIPMVKGMAAFSQTNLTDPAAKSAFERQADSTSYDSEDGLDGAGMYLKALKNKVLRATADSKRAPSITQSGSSDKYLPPPFPQQTSRRNNERWKHDGPWLPGMSAVEFTAFIAKELSTRRAEFNKYLLEYVKGEIYTRRKNSAKESENVPLDPKEAEIYLAKKEKEWSNFPPSDIQAGIRALRAECAADPLKSKLVQNLIAPFLRLPPIKVKDAQYSADPTREVDGQKISDDATPNTTHPSAGLGYLRTKAYLSNHPILGPQSLPAPVPARVVQPRKAATVVEQSARLGVAGFVTDDEYKHGSAQSFRGNDVGVDTLDIETEGGRKINVQPQFATITPDGRVRIKVKRSIGGEVLVAQGQLEDRPPELERSESDPLQNLDLGKSGVPELDAQATEAKMQAFLTMLSEHGARNTER